MDLDLRMVLDDGFLFYNTSEGNSVHTNIDDELQLLSNETTPTTETCIKTEKNTPYEPHQALRRSQRLLFAKQIEKLGGVPYYIENYSKKISNHCVLQVLQESQNSQPETNNDEETTNCNIRAILKEQHTNCEIRNYYPKQPRTTDLFRRRDVTCRGQRWDKETTNRNIRAILKDQHTNCEIRNYYPKQPRTTDLIQRGMWDAEVRTTNWKTVIVWESSSSLRVV